ncbi:copper homeostasis membrane protein CopD [Erwinia sp. 9145]|uniref:copper homeostasis membrane protein CopD n=1 Tax=Erwinia sp. 9145 TaxID=1500895 RepID=UPI00054CF6BE|nr:copper homeostasis membrane protein CopD [Erwinia sp. 9145]
MSLSLFYVCCRWLHLTALITLAGASAFTVLLAPAGFRDRLSTKFTTLLRLSAALSLLSAISLLAAQTGLMGEGWYDIASADVWQAVLNTRFGQVWQWQLIAALTGVIALVIKGRAGQVLLLLSAIGQLTGLAFVGHAAMLEGTAGTLHRLCQGVHLLSAAFWAGGLLPVLLLMKDIRQRISQDEAISTLMRFSRYGHLAVSLTILSGIINARILLGWPPSSFRLYSQLLLAKVLLVALMSGIALINRYLLVPRFRRREGTSRRSFMILTVAELLIAGAALALVSLFATLEPA